MQHFAALELAYFFLLAFLVKLHVFIDFRLRVTHPDAYFITAAPVVAALLQYIDGRRPPGLYTQAAFVEPVRFVEDLRSMGVQVVEG